MEQHATIGVSAGGERHLRAHARKRRRVRLLVFVALVVAVASYYWLTSQDVAPENKPLIATVSIADIENTIVSAGTLQPDTIVDIGAQVSGQLQSLHVEAGDLVEEGQLVAEIDARVQQQRVEASRASIEGLYAQIEAREAALELARANAQRQQRLMAERATSQLEYDSAMNNLISAEAGLVQLRKQIEQAEASLAMDETELEYTNIYAPLAGTVVSVALTEGVTLNANQSAPLIMQIADLSTMTVEASVSEADVAKLTPGMEVYFTTLSNGNRRWHSRLEQILPTPLVENNVVTYTAQFNVENDDRSLLSGMTTQVYFVISAARNVVTVPLGAVTFVGSPSGEAALPWVEAKNGPQKGESAGGVAGLRSGTGGFRTARQARVRVVAEDGSIVEREILVGLTDRVAAEVISGLSPGDRVVAGIVQPDAVEEREDDDRGFGRRFWQYR